MPELPEMQALSERLADVLVGHELTRLHTLQFSALKTVAPGPGEFEGHTLIRMGRRGKFLIFDFGGPRLLIHLSQGGRVDVESRPKTTRPKGAVARLSFDDAPSLLIKEFGTERKAGLWLLEAGEEGPLGRLGPEPDDPATDQLVLEGTDKRRVHTLLRDQHTVAGIGRGYSDDILHDALLSPYASLASLDRSQREALLESIHKMLAEGLEVERKRTGGLPTKVGDHWVVHRRHGQPCPRCGETLKRVSYESHEVTYCPACQTGGKVLADRRLSRLVK